MFRKQGSKLELWLKKLCSPARQLWLLFVSASWPVGHVMRLSMRSRPPCLSTSFSSCSFARSHTACHRRRRRRRGLRFFLVSSLPPSPRCPATFGLNSFVGIAVGRPVGSLPSVFLRGLELACSSRRPSAHLISYDDNERRN